MWKLKKVKLIETEKNGGCQRLGGWGNEKMWIKGYKFS